MRHYEIVFLVHPDQSEQVPAMVERYQGMVTGAGGTVHRFEDWGRRQLAHPIQKAHKAHYVLMNVSSATTAVTRRTHQCIPLQRCRAADIIVLNRKRSGYRGVADGDRGRGGESEGTRVATSPRCESRCGKPPCWLIRILLHRRTRKLKRTSPLRKRRQESDAKTESGQTRSGRGIKGRRRKSRLRRLQPATKRRQMARASRQKMPAEEAAAEAKSGLRRPEANHESDIHVEENTVASPPRESRKSITRTWGC